jgi:uncharacterized HAD superfamily protein
MSKRKAIVCDIDGTICSQEERKKYSIEKDGKTNWDKYFSEELLIKDKLNKRLNDRLKKYKKRGYVIIFLTGRRENLRRITISWFLKNDVFADFLIMREQIGEYDNVEDYKTKKLNQIKQDFEVDFAFEDLDEGVLALKNTKIRYEQIKFK